jgi:hypothetical protein
MISDSAIITIRVAALAILLATAPAAAQRGPAEKAAIPPGVEQKESPSGKKPATAAGDGIDRQLLLDYQRDVDMAKIRRAHLLDRNAEMEKLLRDFAGKYPVDRDREYHYYVGGGELPEGDRDRAGLREGA